MTEVREAYQSVNKDKDKWVAFDEFHLWVEKLQADFVKGAEERIIKWIEENRSALELEPGEYIYRDHFNSQSLIAFIKGENK
jgi:hypothetical protein